MYLSSVNSEELYRAVLDNKEEETVIFNRWMSLEDVM